MHWITIILCFISLFEMSVSNIFLRVKDGRNAKDGEFPFVVSFFYTVLVTCRTNPKPDEIKAIRFCTGSILSQTWILSAAHCVADETLRTFRVWHTNFTTSPIGTKYLKSIRKIVIHPAHIDNDYVTQNDISLILVDKLDVDSLGRLSAVDHLTMMGLPVTYVGGGVTDDPEDDDIRPLQVGEGGIVPCSKRHGFSKYVICVTQRCDNRRQRPWLGDSGGPLLYAGRIIGVTSFGAVDPVGGVDAFAAVSPHLDWIRYVMETQALPNFLRNID
ncbi:brachyurin-like [Trichoplusia ni]|uniref:Brachyurin-like n=1 Tax=Trichoplusia ni TaxID=7111 RepID=A0A7E5WMP1_TRINI|nr:brachyurin-like [Trichoplusia ni]